MAESQATSQQKVASRVALVHLRENEAGLMSDALAQFKITPVKVEGDAIDRLRKEKFDGLVLRLDQDSDAFLTSIRQSPSNKHSVIYAITSDQQLAMKHSKHGINVVLKDPVDRITALRAVRSTYLLAIHEFRRYVRIPVAIEVVVETPKTRVKTLSAEVSGGGMSLQSPDLLENDRVATAHFQLPGGEKLKIKGEICWRKPNAGMIGIRFGATEPGRLTVRQWIENFLVLPD